MKKAFLVLITIALVVGLSLSGIIPVAAQEPHEGKAYTEVTLPLSTETGARLHTIPKGSVVYYLDDGTTEIYGPNNEFILAARDSEAAVVPVPTPNGVDWATHVFQVPNEACIEGEGDTTYVYDGETCILTVVDQSRGSRTLPPPPPYTGWIESSDDWDVAAIDYFEAKWAVPKSPPNAGSTTVDYLFNGITNPTNTVIIQPVLEYNYNYNKKWTGAAWWVGPSSQMRGAQVSASVGNYIWGILSWETTQAGYWDIKLYNINTGGASVLNTKMINTDVDLNIFCALEGVRITGDKDVPGDTTFGFMTFKHGGSTVPITWVRNVRSVPGLTGLQVYIYSQSKVQLRTAN